MYNGVLNIYKPKGFTSHDIVSKVRKIAGMKKVGHTGTLDPMAEGVLPVCLGSGTRIAEYLTGEDKEYIAELTFGKETDTLDAEGEITKECPLPEFTEDRILEVLSSFKGVSLQIPPMYSAIKKNGKPLYKYAREGKEMEIPSREITIYEIQLLSQEADKIKFRVLCSKGTYIRSLARDIAIKAGSCGHLSYLQRSLSGRFKVQDTVTLEELQKNGVEPYLKSIDESLPEFDSVKLTLEQSKKAVLGNFITIEEADKDRVKIFADDGKLIGIGVIESGVLKPKKVFV